MEISRSETIRYSKGKSKELNKRENVIQERIEELDSKICHEVCLDQNILSEYEKLKKELQEIYERKGNGAIFRSKVRWTESGEKPTKYFFNLEKTRYEKKIISQLQKWEDKFVSDFKQINIETENHHSQFYKTGFEENDALTKEFYEAFFDILSNAISESLSAGFKNGQLSVSQKRGNHFTNPKRRK